MICWLNCIKNMISNSLLRTEKNKLMNKIQFIVNFVLTFRKGFVKTVSNCHADLFLWNFYFIEIHSWWINEFVNLMLLRIFIVFLKRFVYLTEKSLNWHNLMFFMQLVNTPKTAFSFLWTFLFKTYKHYFSRFM